MNLDTLPGTVFLAVAYAFATVALGGFLFWSLRELRGLERKQ